MSQQTVTTVPPARAKSASNHFGEVSRASGKAASSGGRTLPEPLQVARPDVQKIVRKLNSPSLSVARDLRFHVDLEGGRSVIVVLDSETGEVIRQIPPEKISGYLQLGGNLAIRLYDGRA